MLFLYLRNVAQGLCRGDTYHLALKASSRCPGCAPCFVHVGGQGAPRHEPHPPPPPCGCHFLLQVIREKMRSDFSEFPSKRFILIVLRMRSVTGWASTHWVQCSAPDFCRQSDFFLCFMVIKALILPRCYLLRV